MTRVCLVGKPDVTLRYELLSRETAREALVAYDLTQPFENSLAVETVSLGAAISFLNDLEWYLVRFVDDVLVFDPSVTEEDWLSRPLADALRNGELAPADTGTFLKVYGLEPLQEEEPDGEEPPQTDVPAPDPQYRLVDPLYLRRTDGQEPSYDLRDVPDTLTVRLTEAEFSGSGL